MSDRVRELVERVWRDPELCDVDSQELAERCVKAALREACEQAFDLYQGNAASNRIRKHFNLTDQEG